MERIKIQLPSVLPFETIIPVRVTDINYGGHLGNDSVLSIIHEVRLQLLAKYGYDEFNIEGLGTIMADVGIQYKDEVFYPDEILAKAGVFGFSRTGFNVYYQFFSRQTGCEVVRAKTALVFYDYKLHKMMSVPPVFRQLFEPE
ncbi:thioesterase [Sphingobacteriales bacterium UPWRP_1]|nr:hypothetical protein B6N25_16785 [Sphingobacteriales bacterium TSM_CSS]PSJ73550.1 thioesterase [Sphingobacteriales bacterium UPWRP_1]